MQKKFLKAFICTTTVLAIIRMTMFGVLPDGDSNIDTVYTSETAEEITVATTEPQTDETNTAEPEPQFNALYSASQFTQFGVIRWNGWKWTWYSERVRPGTGLDIPGRHNDEYGYVCDENGYICLSSSVLRKGTVIDTPFGKQGKVYDTGCAKDVIDVYVSW